MYYSDEIIEEVRSRNDIVDIIGGYVKLKKKGSSYFGLCPFHNEKTGSFSVSRTKQMYYCFGCGAGGSVFTFLMNYENLTFDETVQHLARRSGMTLPSGESTAEEKREASRKQLILEADKEAARYYYYQLNSDVGKDGLSYLINRGLTQDTIKKFGLGYASKYSDGLYKYLKNKGFDDSILKESGLFHYNEKRGTQDYFFNRVMFPIMNVRHKVIGFGGRVMGKGEPKYLNSPENSVFEKRKNLFGLNYARSSRRKFLILCEGYMDVITLHQAGFDNAVASLGTAFTSSHAMVLRRYTEEVVLSFDNDAAGRGACMRAIPILRDAGLRIRVLNMSPYKDPDDFIKNLGAEQFEERVANAKGAFVYEIGVIENDYDLNDPDSKNRFLKSVAGRIAVFEDELERSTYIEAVARLYNINKDELKKLVGRMGLSGMNKGDNEEKAKPVYEKMKKDDAYLVSQKFLLTIISEDGEIYDKIKKYISAEDFGDPIYRKTAELVFADLKETGSVMPAKILNRFEDNEEQRMVAALFNTNLVDLHDKAQLEKAVNETIKTIKKKNLDIEAKNLTDLSMLQKIINEKAKLEKLHIKL